jgi:hypothetical protein
MSRQVVMSTLRQARQAIVRLPAAPRPSLLSPRRPDSASAFIYRGGSTRRMHRCSLPACAAAASHLCTSSALALPSRMSSRNASTIFGLFVSIGLYPACSESACISHDVQPADHPQSSGACRLTSMNSMAPRTAPISAIPPPTAHCPDNSPVVPRSLLEERHARERLPPALKTLLCRQRLRNLALR